MTLSWEYMLSWYAIVHQGPTHRNEILDSYGESRIIQRRVSSIHCNEQLLIVWYLPTMLIADSFNHDLEDVRPTLPHELKSRLRLLELESVRDKLLDINLAA